MLGAIIGDIVGSRFEFNNTHDLDFELFGSGCSFTDDTICTVAVADAMINSKPVELTLKSWCRKYPNPQDVSGGSFARWIYQEFAQPYNSFGNGSAMRVSPTAWLCGRLGATLRYAERSARVTHNHPEGIKGAKCVAHVIWYLRCCGYIGCCGGITTYRDWIDQIVEQYYPGYKFQEFIPGVFDETCQGTVPLCFQILACSHSFEQAIRYAVAWGGDSDTIAAIVGSLAEPIWGIPGAIKQKALDLLPDDMKAVLFKFWKEAKMDNYKSIYYYEQKQSTGSR